MDRRRYGGPFYFLGPIRPFSSLSFPTICPGKRDLLDTGRTIIFLDFPRKRGVFSGICFAFSFEFRNFVFYPSKLLKKYEAPMATVVQVYESARIP